MSGISNQVGDEHRTVLSLQIHIVSENWLSFICRPEEPLNDKHCARLLDKSQSWMTLKAGHAVQMRGEKHGDWITRIVSAVSLYRTYTTKFSECYVESGTAWLAGLCPAVPIQKKD